jgi:opacity protein-like surface antigen
VRTFAGILVAVLSIASAASAQIPTSGNIFIGYSYSRESAGLGGPTTVNLNGWEGSLEGKFLPWIGLVGDFGAGYGSVTEFVAGVGGPSKVDIRKYTYLFGPRVSVPIGRFTPFAHFLVGAGHVNDGGVTDTSFATAVGGGIDYRLIHGVAVRLQGDNVHTRFFDSGQDHFRFSTGIDFRF